MRSILSFAAALLIAAAPALAAPKQKPKPANEFEKPEAILRWIATYREHPQPDKLPALVARMSELGVFKDQEANGVYIGFMAGVIGANPAKAESLVTRMFPMPPEDQVAIVKAIAYSGLPDWAGLMRKMAERMPARAVMIDRHLAGKLPTLATLQLDQGSAPLDTLWGVYYATGAYEPILRIVSVLAWSKDSNSVEKLTVGSMAKWTLANNATRDKELLDHLKTAMRHEPKDTRKILEEIIEAAETFETSKIRKEAVASIELLRVKGPERARQYAWWGMAGQTALALGCITAAALGQEAIGIPCIIGGAASGAALKIFSPTQ